MDERRSPLAHRSTPLLPVVCAALAAFAARPAAAAEAPSTRPSDQPTTTLAGRTLPILTENPKLGADDCEGTVFLVPASSRLAAEYRKYLFSTEWTRSERSFYGKPPRRNPKLKGLSALPRHLVEVHRAPDGRLFLYMPSDFGGHAEVVFREGLVYLHFGELARGTITSIRAQKDATVLRWRDNGSESDMRLSVTETPDVFWLCSEPWVSCGVLLMTPENAAKLDIVVNYSPNCKASEFDFLDHCLFERGADGKLHKRRNRKVCP